VIDNGQRYTFPQGCIQTAEVKHYEFTAVFPPTGFPGTPKSNPGNKTKRYVSKLDVVRRCTLQKSHAYNQKEKYVADSGFSLTRETLEIKPAIKNARPT